MGNRKVAASLAVVSLAVLVAVSGTAYAEIVDAGDIATDTVTVDTTPTAEPTPTVSTTPTAEPTATVGATTTPEPTPTVQPAPSTAWMRRYRGHKTGRIITRRRMVALTFDDGPNFRTRLAVDILDRYGAKGTFFATGTRSRAHGMAAANRYLVKKGHELANHTDRHTPLTGPYLSDVTEIMRADRTLVRQTKRRTVWVRAAGGAVNATGLRATRNTHHLYVQWSIDSYDSHARYTAPHRIYHNVVDHVRRGDVILLHVTHRESLAALPGICRELKRRGYKLVTLSELASHGKPH